MNEFEETMKAIDEVNGVYEPISLNEKAVEFLSKQYAPVLVLIKDIKKISE